MFSSFRKNSWENFEDIFNHPWYKGIIRTQAVRSLECLYSPRTFFTVPWVSIQPPSRNTAVISSLNMYRGIARGPGLEPHLRNPNYQNIKCAQIPLESDSPPNYFPTHRKCVTSTSNLLNEKTARVSQSFRIDVYPRVFSTVCQGGHVHVEQPWTHG